MPVSGFVAVKGHLWPVRQSEMALSGFTGLRADSLGFTVLDGGAGAG